MHLVLQVNALPDNELIMGLVKYTPFSATDVTILDKPTGFISMLEFGIRQGMPAKTIPFDIFVMVVEGTAEIMIGQEVKNITAGEAIVISAHARMLIKMAKRTLRIIYTVIKSGYEL